MHIKLQEIDSLSVTILMDNITDRLLPNSQPFVKRAPMIMNERFLPPPVAEHGFSALLQVVNNKSFNSLKTEGKTSTYLFDTGVSENGVIYNADIFGIDLTIIESIILSHGHLDHFDWTS